MITRDEVLEKVSGLYDDFITSTVRKEGIVDYIMRLLVQESVAKDCPYCGEDMDLECSACGPAN